MLISHLLAVITLALEFPHDRNPLFNSASQQGSIDLWKHIPVFNLPSHTAFDENFQKRVRATLKSPA